MTTNYERMQEALKEVAKDENGYKVVFPWGMKIVELDGEKVLQPMSPKEYAAIVKKNHNIELTEEELEDLDRAHCSYSPSAPGGCNSYGCTSSGRRCSLEFDTNFYCVCVD